MEVKPIILQGKFVRLEPMTEAHAPALAEIGVGQPFWDFMVYGRMETADDMREWVKDILARAEKGTDVPFVAIHIDSGRVAGASRYMNIMPNDRGLRSAAPGMDQNSKGLWSIPNVNTYYYSTPLKNLVVFACN